MTARCATGASPSISASTASSCTPPATNSEEPLLTAIEVTPANAQDGPQAGPLIEQQQQIRPERLLGDTAYGIGPVRAALAEREVEVLAPVPEAPHRAGRIDKREFEQEGR